LEDRRKDGGTNPTFRIKEQGTHLTLQEHDDDDDDDDDEMRGNICMNVISKRVRVINVAMDKQ